MAGVVSALPSSGTVCLRDADYVGGDGADWVDQFVRCAAADFPFALKPASVGVEWIRSWKET